MSPQENPVRHALVAVGFAVIAALAIKAPSLWGLGLDGAAGFYMRNLGVIVLPVLAGYLAWRRRSGMATWARLAAVFVVAAVVANVPAFEPGGALEVLVALHLPIALWLAIGIAHAGGRWNDVEARMQFVRFSGEMFLHYVLIALGGMVLMAFTFAMFQSIGLDPEPVFERWILPCGAAGAVIIAAWLVESGQGLGSGMALVLTRLFTPLFALMLFVFLATMLSTGRGPAFHRDLLIAFDLLLAVVAGLLLFAIAGRDAQKPPGAFDLLQIVLAVAALLVDALALWSIAARISEYGWTPNRVAALGENLLLLASLAGSVVLYAAFVRGRGTFAPLERWQTRFLPVHAGWAALVVAVFPWLPWPPG